MTLTLAPVSVTAAENAKRTRKALVVVSGVPMSESITVGFGAGGAPALGTRRVVPAAQLGFIPMCIGVARVASSPSVPAIVTVVVNFVPTSVGVPAVNSDEGTSSPSSSLI